MIPDDVPTHRCPSCGREMVCVYVADPGSLTELKTVYECVACHHQEDVP